MIEYDDREEFAADCHEALAAEPVPHSVIAGVLGTLAETPNAYPAYTFYAVERVGRQPILAMHTPPHPFHIPLDDADAAAALAEHAHARGVRPARVGGRLESALAFADRWSELTGEQASVTMRLGQYDLGVDPVLPWAVGGESRWATDADLPLVDAWSRAFHREALAVEPPASATMHVDVTRGRVLLWCDPEPVAMAVSTAGRDGVTTVRGVYTPPEHRRSGYGSAVVAAISAARRAEGYTCMLYTDLANPTSNGIYTALGYRFIGEAVELSFER